MLGVMSEIEIHFVSLGFRIAIVYASVSAIGAGGFMLATLVRIPKMTYEGSKYECLACTSFFWVIGGCFTKGRQ